MSNIVRRVGLPKIWGPFVWKKTALNNVVRRVGLPENPKILNGTIVSNVIIRLKLIIVKSKHNY